MHSRSGTIVSQILPNENQKSSDFPSKGAKAGGLPRLTAFSGSARLLFCPARYFPIYLFPVFLYNKGTKVWKNGIPASRRTKGPPVKTERLRNAGGRAKGGNVVAERLKEAARKNLDKMWAMLMDDDSRRDLVFVWFIGIMGAVSGFMTVVNVCTRKWLLMWATLFFFLFCIANILLARSGRQQLAQRFFLAGALVLCGFFCISGTPEGFSALWTCFIPSFTLTMLGNKRGSRYSALGFLMIIVIFWTPWGRSLLQYQYTESFMLRFPMIYVAFYLMALFLEAIRAETQSRLVEAERGYQYLCAHDALTGIYNRYGFNERMDQTFADPAQKRVGLLILDLDLFKNVNDTYGHGAGDIVLKFTADTLRRLSGEEAAVCRWGGEEFTVLWNGEGLLRLAEEIRREIETTGIDIGGETIHVTVSIGVCEVADRRGVTIAELVKGADRCLYEAKAAGRNQVRGIRL